MFVHSQQKNPFLLLPQHFLRSSDILDALPSIVLRLTLKALAHHFADVFAMQYKKTLELDLWKGYTSSNNLSLYWQTGETGQLAHNGLRALHIYLPNKISQ